MTDIYDIEIKKQDGSLQKMSDYKGKILLIVNTATGCGFTPQYQELQELYERYQKDGFE
ncbi:MAG: glutathione peroxidase, partial [Catonella sp.]